MSHDAAWRNHHWSDEFQVQHTCLGCNLPIDPAKPHFKRNNDRDVFCIPCAISGGWLADRASGNVKAVADRQLANAMRKRRFR